MDKAVEAVIEGVKAASPMLWAAAQAKVQADLAVAHFWLWACCIGFMLCVAAFAAAAFLGDNYSEWPIVVELLSGCSGVGFAIGAACNYTTQLQIIAAPQWYAIKALVELSPLK